MAPATIKGLVAFLMLILFFCSPVLSQPTQSPPASGKQRSPSTFEESQPPAEEIDIIRIMSQGRNLTEQQCQQLEEQLKSDANDLTARAKLIGCYSTQRFDSPSIKNLFRQHALWVIKNRPDNELAGCLFLDPVTDPDLFLQAKELWIRQIETHSNNTSVLGNAAEFFFTFERKTAEELLKKLEVFEPNEPGWPMKLAHLYQLEAAHSADNEKNQKSKQALEELEKSMTLSSTEKDKFHLINDLATAAFDVNDLKKAESYAKESLALAEKYKGDWNYGNAIHYGNILLGQISLRGGDIELAKRYLLEAGKTPGSPQLNSFGPDMELAGEMLDKGQREAVIQYFELCGKFWEMGQEKLKDWTVLVKAGRKPDFEK